MTKGKTMRTRIAAALLAVIITTAAQGQGPSATVWFDGTQTEVSDKLALLCADQQAAVSEQDDRHVMCTRPMTGIAAAYAFGGRGTTPPQLTVRFTLLRDNGSIRVQASQWVENQSAMGQIRRSELNGKKQSASLEGKLISIGGRMSPPIPAGASPSEKPAAAINP